MVGRQGATTPPEGNGQLSLCRSVVILPAALFGRVFEVGGRRSDQPRQDVKLDAVDPKTSPTPASGAIEQSAVQLRVVVFEAADQLVAPVSFG